MFGLDFIITLFDWCVYFPLFNALVLVYNFTPGHDFGLAIIFLTLIIRVVLYPISVQAFKSQKAIQRLQPKITELQEKYKDDKERQAKETLELYRKENINPFSSLLLAIIQLPILVALYRVFWNGLSASELKYLYPFVANPGHINTIFLGIMDLSKPNWVFAIIAGGVQFFQTKLLLPKPQEGQKKGSDMAVMMQKQMVYFFPIITVLILLRLPSALGLYWIASGLFMVIQQYIIIKKTNGNTGK